MDKEKLDKFVQDVSAPLFIYRMSKPVAEPLETGSETGSYDDRLTKGAQTKVKNAREEIHELVMAYARSQEGGK